jgi:uncharacterized protein (TIGR02145 family)
MQVSGDDGATWGLIIPTQISGDIGEGITQGSGKHIIWNAADEDYALEGNQYQFKIIANDPTPVDNQGNVYQVVDIGEQRWMAENLKTTTYRDGTTIEYIHHDVSQGPDPWPGTNTGAYGYYENDPANANVYGFLYNWYVVNDSRGVCPVGWHVPSDDEWKELEIFLGMTEADANQEGFNRGDDEGSQLAGNFTLWAGGVLRSNSAFGTSEFDVLPAGYRDYLFGDWTYLTVHGYFWSTTSHWEDDAKASIRLLYNDQSTIGRYFFDKNYGFSIRCLED